MMNQTRSLFSRNLLNKTPLSTNVGESRDLTGLCRFSSFAGGLTTGKSAARVFAPCAVFKGKAALSVEPVLPTFMKVDSGDLRIERCGSLMLTFMPAVGERKYDWEKRQRFALSATEVGSLISMDPSDSSEFYHDPSMKSSNAGQVKKSLSTGILLAGAHSLSTRLAFFLQACSDPSLLPQGRQIHAQFIINDRSCNSHVGAKILGMYALCGSFIDSCKVFYNLDLFCSVPWNWMIRGLARIGWLNFALLFYFKMLGYGVCPDKYTFPCVVKACVGLNDKKASKFIEETVLSMGHEVDAFVASSLIKLQSESGRIDEARKLLDRIPHRDCVLWNTMLNGYLKCGGSVDVIAAFAEMRRTQTKPNSVTFACVLSVCASESLMQLGTQLHGLIVASGLDLDPAVSNTLLAMYSKCAELSNAHKLFQMMPQTDLVSWNCIISGFVQNGCMKEGLNLFRRMILSSVSPDSITLSSLLPALVESGSLKQCREIHGYVLRHAVLLDIFLKSALIDAYFKCRDVVTARTIFNQCTGVDVVVGTAMISGYVLNGMNVDALETFRWLLAEAMSPNDITLTSVLPACANLVALKLGKELHANILKRGLKGSCHVECALMDMYGKCGKLDLAHQIFGKMSIKDSVSWNSMITSCAQNGKPNEAIDIFREMGLSGSKYDCVSVSAVLSACANLPSQHHGKEIHCFMIKEAGSSDVLAESALIDMYAKCGNLEYARRAFERMEEKNEVSWNSIIAAYGNHGCLSKALNCFHEMLENGIWPDHVTFLAIISACGHVGAVNDGIQYFRCMSQDYGITARMEHYACLVDLFGRSGHLKEAFETIKNMPFPPDAGVWGTLLGACRVHGNIELAKVAANNLMSLDSQNSGYYILLSNIHANDRQWGSVLKVRSLMKERGLQKTPGYSWIELKNATHVFVATDGSHPDSEKIYFLLKLLLEELKREGYIPRPYLPMHPQTLKMVSSRK